MSLRHTRCPPLRGEKPTHKDRILTALTKLNDRDTQKNAADDLFRLVADMDQRGCR